MFTQKEQDLLGRIFVTKSSLKDPDNLMFWKIINFTTDERDGVRKAVVRCDTEIKSFSLETDFYITEKDLEEEASFVDDIIREIWKPTKMNEMTNAGEKK